MTRLSHALGALACLAASLRAEEPAKRVPSFVNDVEPALTRLGCNSGSCHGKLAGQNGFKAQPSRVRARAGPSGDQPRRARSPDRQEPASRKPPPGQTAHARTAQGGQEARRRFARVQDAAGLDRGRRTRSEHSKDPSVAGLAIEPGSTSYAPGESHNLKVVATYSGRHDARRLLAHPLQVERGGPCDRRRIRHGEGASAGARPRSWPSTRGRSPSTSSPPPTTRRSTRPRMRRDRITSTTS